MKAVLDSNIFVSAFTLPGGTADKVVQSAVSSVFELAISAPIISEVLRVLARKFARDAEELARAALFMASLGELVRPRGTLNVLRDEPDNRILECALAAKANYIVTGDRTMLSLGTYEGVRILTPREFLNVIGSGPAVHESLVQYRRSRRSRAAVAPA